MAGRERMKLTDAAVARLRPRGREYTVRDTRIAGLGVRVRPTGGRSWVLLLDSGGRTRRVSLGPVGVKSLEEVRRERHARKANPEPGARAVRAGPVPLFRDFVAGPWKEAHFDRCKPSTQRTARYQLAGQLLPAFGPKPLDRIAPGHVRQWFDRYSRTAPGGANRAFALLHQIINFALACGHIEVNPVGRIAPNRRTALTRFLSREELARLHAALDAQTRKSARQQADIVRLLLLTAAAEARSRASAGRKSARTGWRSPMPRRGRGRSRSAAGPGPFSTGSRARAARSCFPRRATPPARAARTCRSGTASDAKPASGMSAFMISGIPWRAMPS